MKHKTRKKPKLPRNRHAANLQPNKVREDKRPRRQHEALDLEWKDQHKAFDLEWKEGLEPCGEW